MEEVWAGETLLAFDGRVLEVFGGWTDRDSFRFHVHNVRLSVDLPDGAGQRWVSIVALRNSAALTFQVPPDGWPWVGPLLDRVRAATPG